MKLSSRARYGLRITFLLGVAVSKLTLSTLVKQTDLSEKYLEQILGMLRRGNIVKSTRGATGGYVLARDASQITVKEVLVALNDEFDVSECFGGNCKDEYCPNKVIFKRLYNGIDGILTQTTIEDMIKDYRCIQ